MKQLASIDVALARIAAGGAVIVVDDEDRENEGDIVFAAEKATPELLAFTMRHTAGVVCVPMIGADLDRLELPPMCEVNEDAKGTAFSVSVDARTGISTGISAADRARTIRLLANPSASPADLSRPGHVFPLRAAARGVLERAGHTEAGVDLARLAGLRPAAVISELVNDDGTMARSAELRLFGRRYDLPIVSIADLIAWRVAHEARVERITEVDLPTAHGSLRAVGFLDLLDNSEHIALVKGDLGEDEDIIVRIHSECLTGDVFHSARCDCGEQLDLSLQAIEREGRGVLIYVRGHEGRGIGLLRKLQAYALQDEGHDTVDANLKLNMPVDARTYDAAAEILRALGVRSVRLLSNNPAKSEALQTFGIDVNALIPLVPAPSEHNLRYLLTKRDRMGHHLPGLPNEAPPYVESTSPSDAREKIAVSPIE
jgi:3,4-dihydroxy 2-butanone 4-phosphate synthase/GTP cyclohydrolase II